MALSLSLLIATFVSEDLACIAAGLLIRRGEVDAFSGVLACTLGIFVGDVALWGIGRLGGVAALSWPPLRRRFDSPGVQSARAWLGTRAGIAIVGSRFLPGTRLPLYVLAGAFGIPLAMFAPWTGLASIVWTPALVLGTAALDSGLAAAAPASTPLAGSAAHLATASLVVLLLLLIRKLATRQSRVRIAATVARYSRWEFWPMWIFYAPVTAWVAVLALRYRGLSTITAANPGMEDGGTVGESKAEILARLPVECTIPFTLIPAAPPRVRKEAALSAMASNGWSFPVILKPNVGQRGVGVRLARCQDAIAEYLDRTSGDVLLQAYHAGPFEAGVFYYRTPGDACGRILSITDKQFPSLTGDGVSTIEQLVWRHPRYRMQAATFLSRHRDACHRVLAPGESFQLAIAGNHAQGTMFRNGWHLWTPALEARIDTIARSYGGFFVGRFDIRYTDVEAFKAGTDLAIVELNGATAESTSIYDPDTSLLSAYQELFHQWSIVFAIGAANRARGAAVTSTWRLFELLRTHATTRTALPISD